MIQSRTYKTRTGALSVLTNGASEHNDIAPVVLAAGFCRPELLCERMGLAESSETTSARSLPWLDGRVADYFDGDANAFDEVAVRQSGTDFQQAVWAALRRTRPGKVVSYSQLAEDVGRPNAVRAIGTACGRNLVAPLVPCHRIVRSNGSLGGYYYGLGVKRWLLEHESNATATRRSD